MAMTDIIMLGVLAYYGIRGWMKGFGRTVLGPVSLVLGLLMSYLYFQKTHNMFLSFAISLFAPALFNWTGVFFFKLLKGSDKDFKPLNERISQGLGAGLNMLWGGGMAALVAVLIAVLPMEFVALARVKEDVQRSASLAVLLNILEPRFPSLRQWVSRQAPSQEGAVVGKALTVMSDPRLQALMTDAATMQLLQQKKYAELKDNPKYQAVVQDPQLVASIKKLAPAGGMGDLEDSAEYEVLMNDSRVTDLISDPEVLRLMQDKKYLQLLNNEKFQEVFQDPELLKKFIQLQQRMVTSGMTPVLDAVQETPAP